MTERDFDFFEELEEEVQKDIRKERLYGGMNIRNAKILRTGRDWYLVNVGGKPVYIFKWVKD